MPFLSSFPPGSLEGLIAAADGAVPLNPAKGEPRPARVPRAELEKRERDLSEALRFAKLASWSADPRTGQVVMSEAGFTLLGRCREEIPPTVEGVFSLFHPDDRQRAIASLAAAGEQNRLLDETFRLIRGDGSFLHAWFRGHPVACVDGKVAEIRGVWQDVTERALVEETLRESEENHRYAVELSPQVPWTASPDGQVLEAGPRWTALTGLSPERALGHGWADAIHPADLDGALHAWRTSIATGEPIDCLYRLRLADESHRWMRARAAPRFSSSGQVLRWYGSLEDIHDRKVAEARLRASAAFSRSIIDSSGDCILVLGPDATIRFVNGPAAAVAGYQMDEFVGRSWLDVLPPPMRAEAEDALADANAGNSRNIVACLPTLSGEDVWWDIAINPIRREAREVHSILIVARDVTDKRMARLEAEAAHLRLADVLESTADSVLTVDRAWRVTYMNGPAEALLGRRLKTGDTLFEIYADYIGSDIHAAYLAAMDGTPSKLTDLFLPNLGITVDLNLRPTRDGVSVFLRDISEAHEARRAITHLAHHDALTGLANRARYTAFLDEDWRSEALGIVVMDLDDFKEVNDTLGHPVGDALLVKVAERFRRVVAPNDLLARLGGDEFAVALPGADFTTCVELARRLLDCLKDPITVDRHELRVGVTIGVAHDAAGTLAETLFSRADIALYQAKAQGGGRVLIYDDELHRRVAARQTLKAELSVAIRRDELSVAYQPMLDVVTDRICAREALMRWHHPPRGVVPPAEFIPLAEETGLIVEMGDWILHQACAEAKGWADGAMVSVNLSPLQFQSGNLPLKVARALADTRLPPSRLELEVTESVLLRDSDDNLAILHALKALGVKIALDDFGTGFSALAYLRNFPFDKIKIDRAFVGDIGRGNHSEAIMAAVVSLGRTLGMTITAEGVETEEQLRWLKEHGCHQVQGYLIGRPGPVMSGSGHAFQTKA